MHNEVKELLDPMTLQAQLWEEVSEIKGSLLDVSLPRFDFSLTLEMKARSLSSESLRFLKLVMGFWSYAKRLEKPDGNPTFIPI